MKICAFKLTSQEEKDLVFKETLLVYQFLEVSLEKAQDILKAVSSKEKNSGFKKIALVLHPDKNRHPQAKEAFQKALQIFNK